MSDYNTGNPVPSIDPRDLDDNATVFDLLLQSSAASVLDRLGVPRKTWAQMEADAAALVSPNVASLASLTLSANKGLYATGANTLATYDLSSLGRTLGGIANAAAGRTALAAAASGANTDIASITGSSATLTTSRTIAATGDGTWSVSFDGSADTTAAFTLATTGVSAGTYGSVTVDAKGRVTAGTTATPVANGGTGRTTVALYLADLETAGAYSKTSVLGTVSQTGGVPTGAVIETGGTVFGTGIYTKYADGTMVITKQLAIPTGCVTAAGSIFRSTATAAGAFPVNFVAAPAIALMGSDSGGGGWAAMDVFGSNSAWGSYSTRNHVSSGTSCVVHLTATGRWF